MWVYVQYLGANDANLSANPGAAFPNTKYCQSLGLLPQVFTVLGVPLWNTNSIDVTLNYPQGAHTARIRSGPLGRRRPARAPSPATSISRPWHDRPPSICSRRRRAGASTTTVSVEYTTTPAPGWEQQRDIWWTL